MTCLIFSLSQVKSPPLGKKQIYRLLTILFFKHNVYDPHCAHCEVEDCRFLPECNLYQNIRNDMLTTVSRICVSALNSLLYGSTAVSVNDNVMILKLFKLLYSNLCDFISS